MEYYSDVKRNEILSHVTTWINFETIVLSGTSHTHTHKYCMIPLI
jgi:hypothetical protein